MKKILLILSLFGLLILVSCNNDNEPIIDSSVESQTLEASSNTNSKETSSKEESSTAIDSSSNNASSSYDNPYKDGDSWHRIG